ncbi:hypothetical protein QUF95_27920 [Paenibacillus silvae]|nr:MULTISPECIES: hypothetical protein [Paenibacillus]MDM5281191.1 hypothetical protein [Paenibacillus silvae]
MLPRPENEADLQKKELLGLELTFGEGRTELPGLGRKSGEGALRI